MCDLITHIEREIRARAAVPVHVTLPPQEGMTTKPASPEYMTDGVLVWQKVGGEWVNITPGYVEPQTVDVEETTKEGCG